MKAPEALREIMRKLEAGETFGRVYPHRLGGDYFSPVLYLTPSGLIGWSHYGSSANKRTLADLAWIFREIFKQTPEEFAAQHTLRSEYRAANS